MSFNIEVEGGKSVRLPTAGKYCDRDIVVTATGGDTGSYDEGYSKAESDFWDDFQNYGNRENYEYGFAYGGYEYIRPKHKVVPTSRNIRMFNGCSKLKKVESQYFDLSSCSWEATGSSTSGNAYTFIDCPELEEIEDIGLPPGYYYSTFRGCDKLKTIAVVRFESATKSDSHAFTCPSLENITISGVIGQNVSFSQCSKLTHDSLMSIINHLETNTSGTWTLTLGTENLAKLTDAEKAIATQKGWTLA